MFTQMYTECIEQMLKIDQKDAKLQLGKYLVISMKHFSASVVSSIIEWPLYLYWRNTDENAVVCIFNYLEDSETESI